MSGRVLRPYVLVVAVGGLVADRDLLAEVADGEFTTLGVTGRFLTAPDVAGLRRILDNVGREPSTVLVVLPGPEPAIRALLSLDGPHAVRTVWYDLAVAEPVPVAAGAVHLQGRGIWGLGWAVRHAVHRVCTPSIRLAYGPHPEQWADLHLPAEGLPADRQAPGIEAAGVERRPLPVAVLLHGGFWRSIWGADLMDALAADLAARGYAVWNLEYRRPDRHGWDATTADVAAGVEALARLDALDPIVGGTLDVGLRSNVRSMVDLDRVAVIGHSAGAQLALRVAADGGPTALVVSLAGVLDLVEGDRRDIGSGAVPAALGGRHTDLPGVYAGADPMSRLPIGVPQLVVQGRGDDLDLIDFNRRYVATARAVGDDVIHLEQPGDHFSVIDPGSHVWRAAAAEMDRLLRPESAPAS
ncbi:alpha/beta hydrolase [Micromonospora sp. NPDC050187]|uniref:alpha/beta hydrolase n=1 Tax=Micromonospora sp. NPDC050187 TaxID=3364277 RepID=UPI00378E5759